MKIIQNVYLNKILDKFENWSSWVRNYSLGQVFRHEICPIFGGFPIFWNVNGGLVIQADRMRKF